MKHLLSRVSPELETNGNSLSELCASGYWLCLHCRGINTREEREQGLPPICDRCGNIRFKLHPASMPELLEPTDLYD
jgi:hypothetical protein